MFPSTHDITPFYLPAALVTLKALLDKGNKVLIVTKPHMECITPLCAELAIYREQILPGKLEIDAAYLRHRSTSLDLWILAQTPRAVLGRSIRLPARLQAEFPDGLAIHAREAFDA